MPRDLERELQERGDGWPAAWNPQPGATLVGTVILYDQGHTQFGPVRTAIIEREEGSRVSLWINSTVLLSLFERDKPKVGERIGLRYLGKHAAKGYRRYHLVVDREPGEITFTPLGGERDDPEDESDPFPDLDREEVEALPYATTVVKGGPRWPMRN